MRKVARIAGIVWLAAVLTAAAAMLTSGQFQNVRGLMYALIGAAFPGFFILRLGMGNRPRVGPLPNPLAPKAPYDHAAEAGHVMRIDPNA